MNALPFFQNIKNALTAGGTGGLAWHIQAMGSKNRWANTKAQIQTELMRVFSLTHTSPVQARAHQSLLLIGASAGWMMSGDWLSNFKEIHTFDIDPFASLLFRLNHSKRLNKSGTALYFHCTDALDQLDRILSSHPGAWIWFDNVLGQHRIRLQNADLASAQLKILHLRLKGRVWGSVHDLYSGPVLEKTGNLAEQMNQAKYQDFSKIMHLIRSGPQDSDESEVLIDGASSTLGKTRQKFLQSLGATASGGAWLDHETSGVFPLGTPISWVGWPFKEGYSHCLEMGWVLPEGNLKGR